MTIFVETFNGGALFTGATFARKGEFKAAGCRWNPARKGWTCSAAKAAELTAQFGAVEKGASPAPTVAEATKKQLALISKLIARSPHWGIGDQLSSEAVASLEAGPSGKITRRSASRVIGELLFAIEVGYNR